MKLYLILSALCSSAVWGATPGPPTPQQLPQPRKVATVTVRGDAPRRLTEEQRAELRRQLEQFNRSVRKHP